MPIIVNNILYISVADLIRYDIVSNSYIKKSLNQQRKGKVYCWAHERFTQDVQGQWQRCTGRSGNVYVVYESLRDKYKSLICENICNGLDPYSYINTQKSLKLESKINDFISDIP